MCYILLLLLLLVRRAAKQWRHKLPQLLQQQLQLPSIYCICLGDHQRCGYLQSYCHC
jgi:hypothetical protein